MLQLPFLKSRIGQRPSADCHIITASGLSVSLQWREGNPKEPHHIGLRNPGLTPYPSIYLLVYLSLSICLSFHLQSTSLSTYLSLSLFIYLSHAAVQATSAMLGHEDRQLGEGRQNPICRRRAAIPPFGVTECLVHGLSRFGTCPTW